MRIAVATLFPGLFELYGHEGLFARGRERGLVDLEVVDIRRFAPDKHNTADDIPYGGGAGMVMKPGPIIRAVESLNSYIGDGERIVLSPRGKLFTQVEAEELSRRDSFTLICGRYKGIDQRAVEILGAREVSVGDYVLGCGEIAALSIIDSVVRLIPDYLGDMDSAETDSLSGRDRLLSAPEYTRPREIMGHRVPEVLLTGNHGAIDNWKRRQSLLLTLERRPDLLEKVELTDEERAYLEALSFDISIENSKKSGLFGENT